jgi:serine/threonine protein kinase
MPVTLLSEGDTLGKYRVVALLGSGGMGQVFRALDEEGREVALKVLPQETAARPTALQRFRREADNGMRLSHENIVALYDFGECEGTWFLAMEFVDGIDLLKYIQKKGRVDPEEARQIVLQVAGALDHAHSANIIHRDIKPSNILLCRKGGRFLAKVTDLGLSREVSEEEFRVTRDGTTVGTVDYLSPEQARDSSAADIRSDIYSLGCSLFHMLSGKPPFATGTLTERLFAHAGADLPDLRLLTGHIPEDLILICERMLAKRPEDRFQTPAELMQALRGEIEVTSPAAGEEEEDTASAAAELASQKTAETLVPPIMPPPPTPDASERASAIDDDVAPAEAPSGRRIGRPPKKPASDELPIETVEDASPATEEQRRAAAGQFERAVQVLAEKNYDYGISLLLTCCQLDPTRLAYRKALREAQWQRFEEHPGGRWLSWFKTFAGRMRLKGAKRNEEHLRVLRQGEELLTVDPGDIPTQLDMAAAAEAAGFRRLAIWILHQARAVDDAHIAVNRTLAVLYEKDADYVRATEMWEHVLKADGANAEARQKIRDLSARETIARGRYYEGIARGVRRRKKSPKL